MKSKNIYLTDYNNESKEPKKVQKMGNEKKDLNLKVIKIFCKHLSSKIK